VQKCPVFVSSIGKRTQRMQSQPWPDNLSLPQRSFIQNKLTMKTAFLILLLTPAFAFGQVKTYYSGDLSANFGKYLEYTGYSANLSGNIKIFDKLYAGVATGVLKVQPLVDKLAIPLSGRITFFTASDE